MLAKTFRIIGLATVLLAGAQLFLFFTTEEIETTNKEYDDLFRENYSVYALSLPEDHDFAGERVPLEDPEVYERLDRELLVNTYWQSNGLLLLKRSNRYFPTIEKILAEEGVPDDFKYLALIESGLNHVVSPAGAASFWQILKSTGRELGLQIDNEVDERYHLEKSTRAACAYLKQAHENFGSWTLAAASYNMGMGGLNKQLERQKTDSYYDLLLNSETSRYMFRILAVKKILSAPSSYGFHYRKKDLYQPFETKKIRVDNSLTDLVTYSEEQGINYKLLKYYNPWLRSDHLTVKAGSFFYVEVPKGGGFPSDYKEKIEEPEPTDSSTVE